MLSRKRGATGMKNGAHTKPFRRARGERQGHAILTREKVIEMRRAWSMKLYSYRELGVVFGVATQTAANAVTGFSWAHVKEGLPVK
jgi:hypothetical protein